MKKKLQALGKAILGFIGRLLELMTNGVHYLTNLFFPPEDYDFEKNKTPHSHYIDDKFTITVELNHEDLTHTMECKDYKDAINKVCDFIKEHPGKSFTGKLHFKAPGIEFSEPIKFTASMK